MSKDFLFIALNEMKAVLITLVIIFSLHVTVNSQDHFAVYSTIVGDSFDIYVNGTSRSVGQRQYIYYLDAEIKSGKELRRQINLQKDSTLNNKVFIGIGHRGNFHQKRQRDYIPPPVNLPNSKNENADRFYLFLSDELIPLIEKQYGSSTHRSLIGHSYGGLFVFYSLLRPERLFQSYYALSPSLWVDKYNIFQRENEFYNHYKELDACLYLSAGGGEKMNHIIKGNTRMQTLLKLRAYQGLTIQSQEFRGKTHMSQLPLSFGYILSHL